jgi:TetR/AcrR family transcriptional regulator, cholesterol catabolism regulator
MDFAIIAERNATPAVRKRRAEIIEAAAEVFAARGYHGATTQDIADVLGIRQASLYYYFGSKEQALELVCTGGVEGYVERAEAIARARGTALEKVARFIENHLAPMDDRSAFVRVFLRERRHLPEASRKRVARFTAKYERIIQGVLERGVAAGELRADLDCRMVTLALLGMCNAATAWYGIEPDSTLERITATFAAMVREGIAARRPRARPQRAPGAARPIRARAPRGEPSAPARVRTATRR